MSATIVSNPPLINPAFNDNIYILSSVNTGETDHRFVVSVKDSGGTLLQRFEVVRVPDIDQGWINLKDLLANYVSFDFGDTADRPTALTNSQYEYNVDIGERYTNGSGTAIETLTDATLGTNRIVTNWKYNNYDFLNYVHPRYTDEFFGNNNTKLRNGSFAWLAFENTSSMDRIRFTAVTPGGNEVTLIDLSSYTDDFLYIPSGYNANAWLPGDIITPSSGGTIVPSDTTSLTVEIGTSVSTFTSVDSHTYTIIPNCYRDYELYYLNEVGTFETLVMNKGFMVDNTIIRKTAKRVSGNLQMAGVWSRPTTAPEHVDRYIGYRQKWKLNTDWITEDERKTLKQLIISPVIYLYDSEQGIIKRVQISDTNYHEKSERIDGLFNFQVTFTESQEQEVQWVS